MNWLRTIVTQGDSTVRLYNASTVDRDPEVSLTRENASSKNWFQKLAQQAQDPQAARLAQAKVRLAGYLRQYAQQAQGVLNQYEGEMRGFVNRTLPQVQQVLTMLQASPDASHKQIAVTVGQNMQQRQQIFQTSQQLYGQFETVVSQLMMLEGPLRQGNMFSFGAGPVAVPQVNQPGAETPASPNVQNAVQQLNTLLTPVSRYEMSNLPAKLQYTQKTYQRGNKIFNAIQRFTSQGNINDPHMAQAIQALDQCQDALMNYQTQVAAPFQQVAQQLSSLISGSRTAAIGVDRPKKFASEGKTEEDFLALGQLQRGVPEEAMVRVQLANGGGVLNPAVEHAGDILHRMNDMATFYSAGYMYVKEKVDRVIGYLTDQYGFGKEMEENIISNARYKEVDAQAYREKVVSALKVYAEAHRVLPVFNDAQRIAQSISVALGEMRWNDAISGLRTLSSRLVSSEEWKVYAHEGLAPEVEEIAPEGVESQVSGDWLRKIAYTRLLHGTAAEFGSFDLSFSGQRDYGDFGYGVYLTPSESMASSYATEAAQKTGGTPVILEVRVTALNFADLDDPSVWAGIEEATGAPKDKELTPGEPQTRPVEDSKAITEFLVSSGFDGAFGRGKNEVVVFDPSLLEVVRKYDLADQSIPYIVSSTAGNWLQKIADHAFEILDQDQFSYREPENTEDEFFYHVTSRDRLPEILESGIRPNNPATVRGWYEAYSKDKSFFIDRGAVRFWIDRVEEHLFHSHDDPPEIVVLRFPKAWVADKLEDTEGTQDSHRPSWYTTQGIPPEEPD